MQCTHPRIHIYEYTTPMAETEVLTSSLFWTWWCPILSLQPRSQWWVDYNKLAALSASIFMRMNIKKNKAKLKHLKV